VQPPWLPQPKEWRDLTVSAETGSADSMLTLYRHALRRRRSAAAFSSASMSWCSSAPGVLDFSRGQGVRCVANLSGEPAALPSGASVLLASGPLTEDGLLPADTTAWVRVA
jgi:alpha-glucosidase